MLFKIAFLTSLLFSAVYPLCFWINAREPLKNNFHRFHLGLPCLVLGLATIIFCFHHSANVDLKDNLTSMDDISRFASAWGRRNILILWSGILLFVTAISWKKESPPPLLMTLVAVWGIIVIGDVLDSWVSLTTTGMVMTILGGMIFCASLFAMNLGHWYLNVHGLPIKHLKNATYVFWALCGLRAIADLCLFCTERFIFRGEPMMLYQFVGTIEGFLLILAILFGTIFPLICLYFVKGTLDVKSTQSATGILYAILCAVVIGDITYKYYFFKYGIVL